MPHVTFLTDYDFHPTSQVTIAYKAGHTYNVTTACATQAIAAGKAKRVKAPNKGDTYGGEQYGEATDGGSDAGADTPAAAVSGQ